MTHCATCRYFTPLQHGALGICMWEWRDLPWNAAVPLTMREDSCDSYKQRTRPAEPEKDQSR